MNQNLNYNNYNNQNIPNNNYGNMNQPPYNNNNQTYNNNNQAYNNNIQTYNNNNQKNKSSLGIISIIIGIAAILLSFIFDILILPIGVLGLVLGIVNIVKYKNNYFGIILNIIAIVISIILFISNLFQSDEFKDFLNKFNNELDYATSDNFIAGKYDCTGVDDNTNEYIITLHLNNDNTFLYGPYGDLNNNYAKGTYTFVDENKTNHSGDYKYFMVTFTGDKEDFIVDGKPSDHGFNSQMEFGIANNNGKKQGVIMFTNTYNMYYCYEN